MQFAVLMTCLHNSNVLSIQYRQTLEEKLDHYLGLQGRKILLIVIISMQYYRYFISLLVRSKFLLFNIASFILELTVLFLFTRVVCCFSSLEYPEYIPRI